MLTFELDPLHYQTCSILAQCCNQIATVHLAQHLPSGTFVAVKKFAMDSSRDDDGLIEKEVILTRQLQHPNILSLHAAFVSGTALYVVSPLMTYGSCRDLLEYDFPDGLPEPVIAFVLRDVLQALDYLHRKGYIHRAVRASHILVSNCGRVCLSGLRYAGRIIVNGQWQRSIYSLPRSSTKNLNWLSPEMLEQDLNGYNEKSDMYSIGMTSCELANGVVPFAETAPTLMLTEKLRGVIPPLLDCSTVPMCDEIEPSTEQNQLQGDCLAGESGDSVASSNNAVQERMKTFAARRFSEPFHQLAELCIQRDPHLRPTAAQMLAHAFFKQCRRGNASLSQLMQNVTTIMDRRLNSQDDMLTMSVADKMSDLELETDSWDF